MRWEIKWFFEHYYLFNSFIFGTRLCVSSSWYLKIKYIIQRCKKTTSLEKQILHAQLRDTHNGGLPSGPFILIYHSPVGTSYSADIRAIFKWNEQFLYLVIQLSTWFKNSTRMNWLASPRYAVIDENRVIFATPSGGIFLYTRV